MFTHPLAEDNSLVRVEFSTFSKKHFLKHFLKDYRGKRWKVTEDSIIEDLRRIKVRNYNLQNTQQVDELWHKNDYWIFKYDFAIAGTKKSPKNSGNRCVVYLDENNNFAEILVIYRKDDLPKNSGEQQWIKQTIQASFKDYYSKVK